MIGQSPVCGRRDFRRIRREFTGLIQSFPPRLPFRKTTGPPFAQVLFADGTTAEIPRQQRRYNRQPVEPREQRSALIFMLFQGASASRSTKTVSYRRRSGYGEITPCP
jgi:hypothetical protein